MMNNVKILAYYLPQFHRIKENDEWWGDGYTEWVKVKKGRKYFEWQNQPKVPLNEEYYDLSNDKVLVEQGNIALNYGIDGFCYYHYWFKGKKLLEKPIESMLENKSVKIPFCLSWANHKWSRIWDGDSNEILMDMNYGIEDDWLIHIKYLSSFFLDKRYLKIGKRPVFLIYQTSDYNDFDKMISIWNNYLHHIGLEDIYLIETFNFFQKRTNTTKSEAVVLFEPMFTLSHDNSFFERVINFFKRKIKHNKLPTVINYNRIWNKILQRDISINKKIIFSSFADWDNTSRKSERGIIFKGGSSDKFYGYMKKLLHKSHINNNEFLFINAWNEWSEGAYLEPDNKNGFSYLEAIKKAKQDYKQI